MMASLRARLLAGLLVLAAIGLVVLAGVTYAEQRSFLEHRVNQQARSAVDVMSRILDSRGFGPAPRAFGDGRGDDRFGPGPGAPGGRGLGPGGGPGPGGLGVFPPPGTYGQRRDASGKVLGHEVIGYGQTALPAPKLPAHPPLGQLITVGSKGSGGLRYRVLARADPEDSGTTIVAVPLREVDQTLDRLLRVEGLVIAGVLLALAGTAFLVVRLGLRPLDRMATTAHEIVAGRLSQRVSPATTRTEVGRLGLALNAMLARLEQAFAQREASEDRLRRFLADASHELRTPLASIRGYAELHRLGGAQDAEVTETSMRRIEEEAQRMGVLVEDLLTLARMDEVRDPVRLPVDVGELARNAVIDARAVAPDRTISLHTNGAAPVTGDPHQLHQVVANLMRNALVHTPGGTPVDVAVDSEDGDVVLEVRDHGPGLPDIPTQQLFERFWRAEGGRERGKGGAGLGLAIVGRVVAAHGGRVEAVDAPDGGARFVVRLPRAGD